MLVLKNRLGPLLSKCRRLVQHIHYSYKLRSEPDLNLLLQANLEVHALIYKEIQKVRSKFTFYRTLAEKAILVI